MFQILSVKRLFLGVGGIIVASQSLYVVILPNAHLNVVVISNLEKKIQTIEWHFPFLTKFEAQSSEVISGEILNSFNFRYLYSPLTVSS